MFGTQAMEVKKLKNYFFQCLVTILKVQQLILMQAFSKENLSLVQNFTVKCKPILKVPLFI